MSSRTGLHRPNSPPEAPANGTTSHAGVGTSPLLTTQQVAAYLRVSIKSVQRLTKQGRLASYRIAGTGPRRYRTTDVERLLEPETPVSVDVDLDHFIDTQQDG